MDTVEWGRSEAIPRDIRYVLPCVSDSKFCEINGFGGGMRSTECHSSFYWSKSYGNIIIKAWLTDFEKNIILYYTGSIIHWFRTASGRYRVVFKGLWDRNPEMLTFKISTVFQYISAVSLHQKRSVTLIKCTMALVAWTPLRTLLGSLRRAKPQTIRLRRGNSPFQTLDAVGVSFQR